MTNFGEIERKMVSAGRLNNLHSTPQERINQPKVLDLTWPKEGNISFQDVYLRYRPHLDCSLKKLSFDVKAGSKIGIVGRTGAGKSTVSQAMSRIVEICGGKIEIDGQNISEIDIHQLRANITVIAQDPTLFTGSLKKNLDPFDEFNCDDIEKLLIRAKLPELLMKDLHCKTQNPPDVMIVCDSNKQLTEE